MGGAAGEAAARQDRGRRVGVGQGVPVHGPGEGPRREAARAADRRDHGGQLPEREGAARPDVRVRGEHDQGQEHGADPRAVQHRERLHPGGGGEDPRGEPLVRGGLGDWVRSFPFPPEACAVCREKRFGTDPSSLCRTVLPSLHQKSKQKFFVEKKKKKFLGEKKKKKKKKK